MNTRQSRLSRRYHLARLPLAIAMSSAFLAACGGNDGSTAPDSADSADSHESAQAAKASTAGSITLASGIYTVVNAQSGKCVDVAGASTTDGGRLQQAGCNKNAAQSFEL